MINDKLKNCNYLTSIPTNLFENNKNITNINDCFKNCASLLSEKELNKQKRKLKLNKLYENKN